MTGHRGRDDAVVGRRIGEIVRLSGGRRGSSSSFMGGSMGVAVGEGILTAARPGGRASGAALIIFPSSGGARMQEGILSLMQMPRTTASPCRCGVKDERVFPISSCSPIPTTGGVSASYRHAGRYTRSPSRAR